jgi:hypothetical protein
MERSEIRDGIADNPESGLYMAYLLTVSIAA